MVQLGKSNPPHIFTWRQPPGYWPCFIQMSHWSDWICLLSTISISLIPILYFLRCFTFNAPLAVALVITKTWPLVNEFCWNWVQLTQPLKSIGFGIKVQSVFWSSRRRRLPRTEQEMIWTNQKLPLMIHVLWPGFPFSFSLCSGPMRKDCCFDSAVQEVLCITWEVSDREIAWVVPKPLTSGYVFKAAFPLSQDKCEKGLYNDTYQEQI